MNVMIAYYAHLFNRYFCLIYHYGSSGLSVEMWIANHEGTETQRLGQGRKAECEDSIERSDHLAILLSPANDRF
jgi:hypothetical protein